MITAKRYQYLLGLVINEKPLPDDSTTEEQQAYEDIKKDHELMHEDAKKRGIKNPELYIPSDGLDLI